jgi:hypothetical protein
MGVVRFCVDLFHINRLFRHEMALKAKETDSLGDRRRIRKRRGNEPMAQNQWNPWTPDDDNRLRALFDAGTSAVLIAAKMKRTISGIKSRARVLKISVKRKKLAVKVEGQ